MKQIFSLGLIVFLIMTLLAGCTGNPSGQLATNTSETPTGKQKTFSFWKKTTTAASYTLDTPIMEVINDPVFGNYGRLIFPVNSGYYGGGTLGELSLTWYNYIDPNKTVEICNYMKSHAEAGDVIFYDIYTDEEKTADPAKADTGLFFFKGNPNEKFAVCNAGARMAAELGSYGPSGFGGGDLPRPQTVVMQYTGHTEYTKNDPPAYVCVGTSDGIASWCIMENRLNACPHSVFLQSFMLMTGFPTVSDLERERKRKGGSTMQCVFGKRR